MAARSSSRAGRRTSRSVWNSMRSAGSSVGALAEMFLEEGDRPLPRQIGGRLVVALGRRVVVEGVVDAVIVEVGHGLAGRAERRDPRAGGRGDALVEPGEWISSGASTLAASDGSGAGP